MLTVLLTCEPASFWRENMITVVILPRVLARMSYWREQVSLRSMAVLVGRANKPQDRKGGGT